LNSITGKNFRLPTEAEWEYAARGGNKSHGCLYAGSNIVDEVAWYANHNNNTTHPVKTKKPNELGLYEMSGNVYEWCEDWYGEYSSNSQLNPKGLSKGYYRVVRGGSWKYNAWNCRVTCREAYTLGDSDIGFRLALDVE
jgi:formylglycine-generating enzyme required for sulfatase activity